MLEKFLEEIGLSDKEAKVYLALLEVDDDSVLGLAERTQVNRTTVYPVLETLEKKGLVSEVQVDKKTHYRAEPPERLQSYVERRRVSLDEQQKRLADVVPQLKSLAREGGKKPVIKYYDGKEGVLSAMEEYFGRQVEGDEKLYMAYSLDLVKQVFTQKEIERAAASRKSKDIEVVSIYNSSEGPRETKPEDRSDRTLVDPTKYPIPCDIGVFGNLVRIHTLGEKVAAIYIESADLAQAVKSLIALAAKGAKAEK